MLFHYTENDPKKAPKPQNTVKVRKAPLSHLLLCVLSLVLLVAAGVLFFIFEPIPQYFVSALCLLIASLIPVFFILDFLVFRLSIGSCEITLRKLTAKEAVHPYTDISWKLESSDKKRSAILLYAKGKPIARILYGAPGYRDILSLRHKGSLSDNEKELLRKTAESASKSS